MVIRLAVCACEHVCGNSYVGIGVCMCALGGGCVHAGVCVRMCECGCVRTRVCYSCRDVGGSCACAGVSVMCVCEGMCAGVWVCERVHVCAGMCVHVHAFGQVWCEHRCVVRVCVPVGVEKVSLGGSRKDGRSMRKPSTGRTWGAGWREGPGAWGTAASSHLRGCCLPESPHHGAGGRRPSVQV